MRFLLLTLAAAMLALSACSHHRQLGDSASPAVIVKATDFKFSPESVRIVVGQTIEWGNDSILSAPTVTCDPAKAKEAKYVQLPAGANPFNSGEIRPGEKFRHTFQTPGTYRYFCIPHEKMGMVGEVIVAPG